MTASCFITVDQMTYTHTHTHTHTHTSSFMTFDKVALTTDVSEDGHLHRGKNL
jgi:hypothetical protein